MSNDNLSNIDNTDRAGGIEWLCLFFPVVGLILYLVWQKNRPVAAKQCGKFAIIGTGIWFVLGIIIMVISMIMVNQYEAWVTQIYGGQEYYDHW